MMSSDDSRPSEFHRRACSVVVEPGGLVGSMAVGGLPDFADPSAIHCPLPSHRHGCREVMGRPCVGCGRVFQHAAAASHMLHGSGEASAIIAGSVVFATPSPEVDWSHPPPELAGRVCHYREIPIIAPSVPAFRPRIHPRKRSVASTRLHEQRRHQRRTRRWMERRGASILDSSM